MKADELLNNQAIKKDGEARLRSVCGVVCDRYDDKWKVGFNWLVKVRWWWAFIIFGVRGFLFGG